MLLDSEPLQYSAIVLFIFVLRCTELTVLCPVNDKNQEEYPPNILPSDWFRIPWTHIFLADKFLFYEGTLQIKETDDV